MKKGSFDGLRFWLLLRDDLRSVQTRNFLLTLLLLLGACLGLVLLNQYTRQSRSFMQNLIDLQPMFYILFLFIWGLAYTGKAFDALHDPNRAIFQLGLPVTRLERLAEKWLLCGILLPAVTLFLFALTQAAICQLSYPLLGASARFHLSDLWKWIHPVAMEYVVFQTIILLRSALYPSNTKTRVILFYIAIPLFVCFTALMTIRYTFGYMGARMEASQKQNVVEQWADYLLKNQSKLIDFIIRSDPTLEDQMKKAHVDLSAALKVQIGAPPETKSKETPAHAQIDATRKSLFAGLRFQWMLFWYLLLPGFCLFTTYVRLGELET